MFCDICIICKGAERIDSGMYNNAWNKAAAAVKNRDKQKADSNCKAYLTQVV